MGPFTFEAYHNPYVQSISQLMMAPAQAQAQGALTAADAQARAQIASGQAWAGAAQGIGQSVEQAFDPRNQLIAAQLDEVKQRRADLQAFDKAFAQPGGRDAVLSALPGHLKLSVLKQFNDADESAAKVQEATLGAEKATTGYIQTLAEIAKAHNYDPMAFQGSLTHAKQTFQNNPSLLSQVTAVQNQLMQDPTPATVQSIVDPILKARDAQEKPLIVPATPRGGAPAKVLQGDQVIATGSPTAPEQPTSASIAMSAAGGNPQAQAANQLLHPTPPAPSQEWKEVMVDGVRTPVFVDPKTKQITDLEGKVITNPTQRIRAIPPASTIINPQTQNDVKDAVAAMKEGTAPPLLPGRATKEYLATIAEARRQGFDIERAATDWNATQKHIATLNGAQQKRLMQNINALPEMLDKVDALASQWKGGRFPVLNKANLIAAKNGAYGSEVASVANQLDAQIADVTADLGNVYMGGNSPTDHSLDLASKSLQSNWDEKVLHDMVQMAKANVTIRRNSILNTGVAGASPNNPYAPPAGPKPTGRYNPVTGKVEPIPQ